MIKKYRKLLVLLLSITLLTVPTLAKENPYVPIIFDDFEGKNLWQVQSLSQTATYGIGNTAQAGEKGYTITTEDYRGVELYQTFNVPTDGRQYVFSAYVMATSTSEKAGATLLVRNKAGTVFAKSDAVIADTNNAWKKETITFTLSAPMGTEVEFVLKWNSVGTVHWDTISVAYAMGETVQAEVSVPIGEELFANPGFESMTGWHIGGKGAQSDMIAYEGQKSVQLKAEYGTNSYVFCRIDTLEAGATYALRFKILATETGTEQAIKMQYYTSAGSDLASFRLKEQTVGAWHEYCIYFSPPVGINRTEILFRTYEKGVTYYDDVSLRKTANPLHVFFDLNELYYYTDLSHGYARLDVNDDIYTSFASWSASVTVQDAKGKVLYAGERESLSAGKHDIPFPLSDVPISEEACTVFCTIWNGAQVLETHSAQFYRRFPRPSMITKDGKLQKDGMPLHLVYGYHVSDRDLDKAKELGVNTILMSYDFAKDSEAMLRQLDMLQEKGFYGIVCLYTNMKSGGSPENIESTKTTVENARNHPALIGYAIMDEPIGNDCPPEEIIAAYCAIRERDNVHPVYMVDMYPSYYRTLSKWTDIVAADHYPYYQEKSVYYTQQVLESIEELVQYSSKPTAAILQFFPGNNYFPTADEMRNMIYQAFFAGADSIGYYAFDYSINGTPVEDTAVGNAIRAFSDEEQKILFDYYVDGKYRKLSGDSSGDTEWEMFSDGKRTFVAVRNKKVDTPVTMDMQSGISQNAYIRIVGGAEKTTVAKKENGVFRVEIPAAGAVLYELTDGTGRLIFYDGIFSVGTFESGENISVLYDGNEKDTKICVAVYQKTEFGLKLISSVFSAGNVLTMSVPETETNNHYVLKAYAWAGRKPVPLTQSIKLER